MISNTLKGAEKYLNLAAGIIIAIDENQIVRFINEKGCQLLETSKDFVLGKNWFDTFLTDENREEIRNVFFELLQTNNVFFDKYDSIVRTQKDNIRYISWYNTILTREDDKVSGILSLGEDVTDKTILLQRLSLQENIKRKELISAVLDTQEKERYDIAVELHDNVNQILTTCKLLLEQETYSGNRSPFVKNTSLYIQKAMDEIRSISHRLNPTELEDLGFEQAIYELVNKINLPHQLNLLVNINGQQYINSFPSSLSITIFRIVQEQLSNIIKYAEATNVEIKIHADEHSFDLEIKDNGKGFDLKKVKKGIGIKNIYSRTELYSGTVYINTAPGDGCTLSVHLPL